MAYPVTYVTRRRSDVLVSLAVKLLPHLTAVPGCSLQATACSDHRRCSGVFSASQRAWDNAPSDVGVQLVWGSVPVGAHDAVLPLVVSGGRWVQCQSARMSTLLPCPPGRLARA